MNYLNSFAGRWQFFDAAVIFKAEYLGWWMLAGVGAFLAVSAYLKRGELKARHMVFVAVVSGLLSRFVVTEIIRFFYDRPRPFDLSAEALAKAGVLDVYQLIEHSGGGSFPSGHAAFFFAVAAGVFIYYKKWGILFYLFALAMGLSRVIAGIHWPSDILGGAIIGIASAYLTTYVVSKYQKHSDI